MNIFIYPDNARDDELCESKVKEALVGFCDQAYENTAVDGYAIYICYDHPNEIFSSSGIFEARSNWKGEFEKHGPEYTGVHLLVDESHLGGGAAEFGDATCDNDCNASTWSCTSAFNDALVAVVGRDDSSEGFFLNAVIHEVAHTFIDRCLCEDMIEDTSMTDDGDHEHDLGKVYYQWGADPVSPMASGYVGGHSQHGSCSDEASHDDVYSHHLTQCTEQAIDRSVREHA